MKKIFLNDRFILLTIILNSIFLYFGGSPGGKVFPIIDDAFTLFFLVEVIVKVRHYSWKNYWSDKWNRFDFIITMVALPSLAHLFVPEMEYELYFVLCMRLLRVFKIFRIFKFIPNLSSIIKGVKLALKSSVFVLIGFVLIVFVTSILLYGLFGDIVPEYFGSPITSTYTTFRFFTVEGWYEIPDAIAAQSSDIMAAFAKGLFCVLLFAGGIIGMSLVNSILVDAMVSDNNDDVLKKLDEIKKELLELRREKDGGTHNDRQPTS